jgi:diguanylate cyclase (GGDEF)-like protein/PAS domain S-box-containing protein
MSFPSFPAFAWLPSVALLISLALGWEGDAARAEAPVVPGAPIMDETRRLPASPALDSKDASRPPEPLVSILDAPANGSATKHNWIFRAIGVAAILLILSLGLRAAWLDSHLRRKRALLVEGEEKLRQLSTAIEQGPASVIVTDADANILYVNKRFCEITGYAPEEVIGQNPRILQSGKTVKEVHEALWMTITTDGAWQGELINRKKSGEIYWEEAYISPVRDDAGKITHYVGIKLDITERRKEQQALRDSEERLRLLLDSAGEGIYGIDAEGRCTFANPACLRLLGYESDADLLGKNIHGLIHHSCADGTPLPPEDCKILRSAYEGKAVQVDDEVYWRADGEPFEVEYWSHPQKRGEEVVGAVVVFSNIAERRRAQSRERTRNRVLEMLARGEPLEQILTVLALGMEAENPAMLCSILLLDDERRRLLHGAAPSLPDDYNAAIHGLEIGHGVGSCGTAAHSGQRVIVEDIQNHPYWAPFKELAASKGLAACWSEPILAADGHVLGTFAIYHRQPRAPDADELALISAAANLAAVAIEHKLAARALRDSSLYTRSLLEASPDPLVVINAAGKITDVNLATEQATGQAREALIGSDFSDYFTDSMQAREGYRRVFSEGRVSDYPLAMRHASGKVTQVLYNASVYRDESGIVQGVFAAAHDISALLEKEEALQNSERFLTTALDALSSRIAILNERGIVIFVNRSWRLFWEENGLPGKEHGVGSRYFTPLVAPSENEQGQIEAIQEGIRQVLNGESPGFESEYACHSPTEKRWFLLKVVPFRGIDGRYVIVNHENIGAIKQAMEKIRNLAYYDPLTNLPNRRLLLDRLEHQLLVQRRKGLYGAILFMDLDHFKTLNDSLGHHIGDLLLEQTARRLQTCLRKEDTPARLGGDEFVVLLAGEHTSADQAAEYALSVAERIKTQLSEPFRLLEHIHHISTSIGITLFPNDGAGVDDLLKQADAAMYTAKAEGRNGVRFYEARMQTAADERLNLEKELRLALANEEFVVYYQPQVNGERRMTGAEALVRWESPRRGLVMPAGFIPMAEENGLILPIGDFVLDSVCRCLAELEAKNMAPPHIAVNISARQFQQADFVDRLRLCLERAGISPRRLYLELTEGILARNDRNALAKIEELKNMGVGLSIDDFGVGYSSLAYLKTLPLDELKIAQNFVRDIESDRNDEVIVQTIIAMANHLKLNVIAEGVENRAQMDILANYGCRRYQGFYCAQPMPEEAFVAFVETGGVIRCGMNG